MKKILILLLALSVFSVDAQTKKRTTKKRTAKKTTVAKQETPAPAVEAANVNTEVTATAQPEADLEPINSLSILNAKSPAAFRVYREIGTVKKGDSVISARNKPISYGYIDEKDVLRSMVVWEIIDMNEKINQPFYHNADGIVSQNKSLYQLLIDNIMSGDIKEVYDDEMFMTKLAPEAIKQRLSVTKESDWLIDKRNAGENLLQKISKLELTLLKLKLKA